MRTFALADRLGCSTITFRHQTLFDALASIAASGVTKVDIACIPGFCDHINPLESSVQGEHELQSRLSSLGLAVSTLNVSAGGLNTDRKDFVFRYTKAAIDLAERLGCYAITIPSGAKVSDLELWERNAHTSARSIRELADHATGKGIRLTLEAPHTGTLAEDVAETASYFQLLNDPRVACTFDTSHVARGNPVPVAQCIAQIGGDIGHVHLRDCVGENNHLTPGKGDIDFYEVLLKLQKVDYVGDLILELEGEDSEQSAAELAYAISYLRGLEA
jgi:sugar phosphate isomerase/epimerase